MPVVGDRSIDMADDYTAQKPSESNLGAQIAKSFLTITQVLRIIYRNIYVTLW